MSQQRAGAVLGSLAQRRGPSVPPAVSPCPQVRAECMAAPHVVLVPTCWPLKPAHLALPFLSALAPPLLLLLMSECCRFMLARTPAPCTSPSP